MYCSGCKEDGKNSDLVRLLCGDVLCSSCFDHSIDRDSCMACVCCVQGERTQHRTACGHPVCLFCFRQLHLNTGNSCCPACRSPVRHLYVSRFPRLFLPLHYLKMCRAFFFHHSFLTIILVFPAANICEWSIEDTKSGHCTRRVPSGRDFIPFRDVVKVLYQVLTD